MNRLDLLPSPTSRSPFPRLLLICLLLLLSPTGVDAKGKLVLEPGVEAYDVVPYLDLLVDRERKWDLENIRSEPLDSSFLPSTGWVNLGITRAALWVRFTLENRDEEGPADRILVLDIPPMAVADLYLPSGSGGYARLAGGASVPHSRKAIRYRAHAYPLHLSPGARATCYMALASEETLVLDLKLLTPLAFRNKENRELSILVLIAGVFLAVSLSNLMIFFSTRDRTYLYLVLFVASFAMFLASNFGVAGYFLWPEYPAAARICSPLAGAFSLFWGMIFCRKFTDSRTYLPRLDPFFLGTIVLSGLLVPLTFVDSFAGNWGVGALSIFVIVSVLFASLYRLRNRYDPARLFLAAMVISMVGGVLSWLMVFGLMEFGILTFGLGPLSIVAGVLFLSMAVGNRLFTFQSNYRETFNHVNDPILVYSPESRSFLDVNQSACDLYGYSRAEWLKLQLRDILVTSSPGEAPAPWVEEALRHGSRLVEAETRKKNGELFWGELNIVRARISNRSCLLLVVREVTKRKELEASLQAAFQEWQSTFDAMNDAVCILSLEGKILRCNRTMGTLVNEPSSALVGRPCWEVMHGTAGPVEGCPLVRMKETLRRETMPFSLDKRHCEITVDPLLDSEGRLRGALHIVSDVTLRRKMEEELLRARKMESVGVLAGGIAHDFNNILMVIWGNVSLAKMRNPADGQAVECLDQAEKACGRARDLAQQLLTFSRGGAPLKEPLPLRQLLQETAMPARDGSQPVGCVYELDEGLWWVDADRSQIHQLFDNLILNAVQALPEGGKVRIRGRNRVLAEHSGLPLKAGQYVEVSVEDDGVGITKENLSRVFDPYFTTKQAGSGLGLTVAHSVATRHEGHIRVESAPGEGSAFTVYLPAVQPGPEPTAPPEVEKVFPGRGAVLLMDDERMVRDVAGRMLEHLGYKVTFAKDGAEALELYRRARESAQPFDLVILDLTVPRGMGGRETVKKLLEMDPGARAVVSSGYFDDPVMAEYRRHGFVGVIPKPYTIEAFSRLLKTLLG